MFDRARFFLRPKRFSHSERYFVSDERGERLLYVERSADPMRSAHALFGAITALVFTLAGGLVLTSKLALVSDRPEGTEAIGALISMFTAVAAAAIAGVALSPKRDVNFYRDESKRELALRIRQDAKFLIVSATYTVEDGAGRVLARLSTNPLVNTLRKRWRWDRPNGERACVVTEDSMVKSIARRLSGIVAAVLRTNFEFRDGDTALGQFDRRLTQSDQYVLDLTHDVEGIVDRRVALAMTVMIDIGEKH